MTQKRGVEHSRNNVKDTEFIEVPKVEISPFTPKAF